MGISCWLEGWGENRIQPFCISSSMPNTSLGKNPDAHFGTLGCPFFCWYPLLSAEKLWALTAECIFLHVQWYVLIALFYSLLSNVKEFICKVCRAGLALTSCLFLGAWVAACPTPSKSVLGISPPWNPISNTHTHTEFLGLSSIKHAMCALARLPELQRYWSWFGRGCVLVPRGDIAGAQRCWGSALWHPDPTVAFKVV